MADQLWWAPNAKMFVGSSLASVSGTSSLDDQVTSTDFTAEIKEVSVTGGGRDVSKVDLMGNNQVMQFGRPELVECSFTLVGLKAEQFSEFMFGTAITAPAGYTRYQGGEKANSSDDRQPKAVLIHLKDDWSTDTTGDVALLLNKAYATDVPEYSFAADGTLEATCTFKCLAVNYYEEFKD